MVLAQDRRWHKPYVVYAKSFLVWSFTLAVSMLVVGFPIVFLMATVAVLAAIILQAVLPMSAVVVVVASILGINLLVVFLGAMLLTLKGIHPDEVRWLNWLHGNSVTSQTPRYASCPLTCQVMQAS